MTVSPPRGGIAKGGGCIEVLGGNGQAIGFLYPKLRCGTDAASATLFPMRYCGETAYSNMRYF
jgi:hypothetical protein